MARKFLTPIDLSQLELQNATLQNLGTDPASPTLGQFWFNTAVGRLRVKYGAASVDLHPSATAATANTLVLRDASGDATVGVLNATRVAGLSAPLAGTDAATKDYVDAARAGLSIKDPVRVATTANLAATRSGSTLTASGNGSINDAGIDGVTNLVVADRVLVKNQATGADNGWYRVTDLGSAGTPWVMVRADDADAAAEVRAGACSWVNEGTTNGDTRWALTTNDPVVLNTTALVFTQDGGLAGVTAGTGLSKTGNTLSIAASYAGQTSITTLGTVATGVWDATTIAIAKGGTGATSALGAFDALSGMTAVGDMLYGGAAGSRTVLAGNITTTRKFLRQTGSGAASAAPAWDTLVDGDLPATLSANARVAVSKNGTAVATRRGLNLIEGTNVTLTVADNPGSERVDVTVNSTSSVTKYAVTVGDGVLTSFNIAHGLATEDVIVIAYDVATKEDVTVEVDRTDANTAVVRVAVAPATNSLRIVAI